MKEISCCYGQQAMNHRNCNHRNKSTVARGNKLMWLPWQQQKKIMVTKEKCIKKLGNQQNNSLIKHDVILSDN